MPNPTTVSVRILDKDYQFACNPDEVDALTASARLLDEQMAEIRDSGRVLGLDRIAVMAAMNIANDFLHTRNESVDVKQTVDARVLELTARIDRVLANQQQD